MAPAGAQSVSAVLEAVNSALGLEARWPRVFGFPLVGLEGAAEERQNVQAPQEEQVEVGTKGRKGKELVRLLWD